MRQPKPVRGFTLVELLVVIGIIALLISILLPALNAARRQAAQTKCAAQMKQMHNAFLLYAIDNRGYWPVAKLGLGTKTYTIGDNTFPISGTVPYYFDFVARYVTKNKVGVTSTNNEDAAAQRNTVIWGCPSFDGYYTGAIGGMNRIQPGIGMNGYPTFTATNPPYGGAAGFPPSREYGYTSAWDESTNVGKFYPATVWGRQGASRMLLSDSRFWLSESNPMPTNGVFPPQPLLSVTATYTTPAIAGQTMVDVYRHGKYPAVDAARNAFAQKGGKVAYNVLYCDGHVSGQVDQRAAYESIRQRFPN